MVNDKSTITKNKILQVIVKHDSQLMVRYRLQAVTTEKPQYAVSHDVKRTCTLK
jgi:hypothetical protein